MLRIRFKANEPDYRPVKWPVKYPYWCTGYGDDYATVISYANNTDYIYENWPEAADLEVERVSDYAFTDRFPRPEWFVGKDDDVPGG